jgi:hypothetical protein
MYDRFLRTLGRYARLITFDPDRPLHDQIVDAYLAVLDAVGVQSVWVAQKCGYLARLLAVRHRPRIDGAVMLSGMSPASLLERRAGLESVLVRGPAGRGLEQCCMNRAVPEVLSKESATVPIEGRAPISSSGSVDRTLVN